ncbi:MAG: hypothetical protein ACO31U_05570 [Ilumatobacteraceae bacterium]
MSKQRIPRRPKTKSRHASHGTTQRKPPSMWDGLYGTVEVRRVQPYEANKVYVCPGCHQHIPKGTGHLVCVPSDAPDLRRHWHKGCWERRDRRTRRRN